MKGTTVRTLAALALAVAMLASTPAAAFAQTETPEPWVTVMVDGTGPFSQGDTITVSGTVRDALTPPSGISIRIHLSPEGDESTAIPAPQGQTVPAFVKIEQVNPSEITNNSFSKEIKVGGPSWTRTGDYIVAASYGSYDAQATFNYI
ncbi:MAG: hypothetical protein EB832_01210, partial [Thaumarchaeota archaeon S14]